jgi:hypothetical protein
MSGVTAPRLPKQNDAQPSTSSRAYRGLFSTDTPGVGRQYDFAYRPKTDIDIDRLAAGS